MPQAMAFVSHYVAIPLKLVDRAIIEPHRRLPHRTPWSRSQILAFTCSPTVFGLSPYGMACSGHDVVILPLVEVGLLKVAPYGDDPMRAGHLELQIGVVGDGHELGIAWLVQDGEVGARKVRYLKGEHLHAKVGSTPKHYRLSRLDQGGWLGARV